MSIKRGRIQITSLKKIDRDVYSKKSPQNKQILDAQEALSSVKAMLEEVKGVAGKEQREKDLLTVVPAKESFKVVGLIETV